MDDERAEHDGDDGIAGDAEAEGGDEGGLCGGVVCCLGGDNAFDGALTQLVAIGRNALFNSIGNKGRQRCAGAGQDAEHRTDAGAANGGHERTFPVVPRGEQGAPGDIHGLHRAALDAAGIGDDLGNTEQAGCYDDQVQPVAEFGEAAGKAPHAAVDVGAHDAEQQAEHHHGKGAGRRAIADQRGGKQAHGHQREIFR